ncbi:hypothetical protein [Bradyrhizobium sp. UNPF46]|uniref:hypothetical protein n=1 Tax=Bradyrhizobium sp. UNPF46 TaxID=1141168 RepID=UPI001FEF84CD|nr:hypothetical protein [Bradyrhizobium sp. UNPF46]
MSDSGIGTLLGQLSADLLRLWFIGAFVLGEVLVYGVMKAGQLRRGERAARSQYRGTAAPGRSVQASDLNDRARVGCSLELSFSKRL